MVRVRVCANMLTKGIQRYRENISLWLRILLEDRRNLQFKVQVHSHRSNKHFMILWAAFILGAAMHKDQRHGQHGRHFIITGFVVVSIPFRLQSLSFIASPPCSGEEDTEHLIIILLWPVMLTLRLVTNLMTNSAWHELEHQGQWQEAEDLRLKLQALTWSWFTD